MMAELKTFLISFGWFILAVAELVAGPGAREHFDLDIAQVAAANGDRDAAYFLGHSFAKGIGVPQDYVPRPLE
jgi:TPR repeat protein